jgi:hypothetical protein
MLTAGTMLEFLPIGNAEVQSRVLEDSYLKTLDISTCCKNPGVLFISCSSTSIAKRLRQCFTKSGRHKRWYYEKNDDTLKELYMILNLAARPQFDHLLK